MKIDTIYKPCLFMKTFGKEANSDSVKVIEVNSIKRKCFI